MENWSIKSPPQKTAYQLSIEEAERGEVNEYSSPAEFYKEMGISSRLTINQESRQQKITLLMLNSHIHLTYSEKPSSRN